MNSRKKVRPKFIAYVVTSIDGRISLATRVSVSPNWASREDWKFFQGELAKADAVVVGRNTYESVASRLRKRNTFVFSGKLQKIARRGSVTFVNPNNIDIAQLLFSYKVVAIIGGGQVYQTMLDLNLLDEIFVTIEPLIFGRGKGMFSGGTTTSNLQLISVKKLNVRGTLLMHYKVKNG